MFERETFWGWLTLVLVFFLIMGIILHATNFATAAGTLFTGVQGLGTSLEAGQYPAQAPAKK